MNRLFFLVLLFWAEVREDAAAIVGLESGVASRPESGAATVSGLRTREELGRTRRSTGGMEGAGSLDQYVKGTGL